MKPRCAALVLLVVAPFAAGCRGKLLATARLTRPGSAEAHFHAGKKVQLWSDYEGTWMGGGEDSKMPLRYDIEVVQGGHVAGHVTCVTSDGGTAVCGSTSDIFGEHSGDCEVTLPCSLPKLASGDVVLRVKGSYSEPGRIKSVKKMSLNVRED